jgi:hypothetical protein
MGEADFELWVIRLRNCYGLPWPFEVNWPEESAEYEDYLRDDTPSD